jgi:hypothetical protein
MSQTGQAVTGGRGLSWARAFYLFVIFINAAIRFFFSFAELGCSRC